MLTRRSLMTTMAAAGGYCLMPGFALAQTYPNGPIRMVIGYAAGGIGDIIGRAVAEKMAAILKQPVLVENRTGAGGIVGMQQVATARPDGYTILHVTGAMVGATLLQQNVNVNLHDDFTPIAGIGSFPSLLCTSSESEIKNFDDISSPGGQERELKYASGGIGSNGHLVMVALLKKLGVAGLHIPYKGNVDAAQTLLSGQVDLAYLGTTDVLEMVTSGRLRAIAVAAPDRLTVLPDVPTMAELGHEDLSAQIWYGFVAPSGTPPEIVNVLYEAIAAAIREPQFTERFEHFSYLNTVADASTFGAFLTSETERWGKIIKENGISLAK